MPPFCMYLFWIFIVIKIGQFCWCLQAVLKILEQIKNNLDEAFIIMGDFNNIMNSWEKEGGIGLNLSQVDMFRDFINSMAIKDLNFRGPIFTWNNYRNGATNIKEQLDRVLASVRWMNGFPDFLVEHFEDCGSDHRPILLNTSPSFPKAKKLFKDFNSMGRKSHSNY